VRARQNAAKTRDTNVGDGSSSTERTDAGRQLMPALHLQRRGFCSAVKWREGPKHGMRQFEVENQHRTEINRKLPRASMAGARRPSAERNWCAATGRRS
jgi:hypothetical protein